MKQIIAQSNSIFRDRPLQQTPRATRRLTSAILASLEQTDYVDSFLRAFLALSLLGSLAVCSREWSAPASKVTVQAVATPAPLVASSTPARHEIL